MLISTVFSSCTLEKRHYRNGFYVHRPAQHQHENRKEIALRDTAVAEHPFVAPTANVASEEPHSTPEISDSSLARNDKQVVPEIKITPDFSEPDRVFKPGKHHNAFPPHAPVEKDKKISTICAWLTALFLGAAIVLLITCGMFPPFATIILACLAFAVLFLILTVVYYPRKAIEPVASPPSSGDTQKTVLVFGLLAALFLAVAAVIGIIIFIVGDIQ